MFKVKYAMTFEFLNEEFIYPELLSRARQFYYERLFYYFLLLVFIVSLICFPYFVKYFS